MREPYAHEVELFWVGAEDEREPGGAITVGCGVLSRPPCPVAAHHTSVVRRSMALEVRVLFACEPDDEQSVRERIDTALGARVAGALHPDRDGPRRRDDDAARLVLS